MLGRPSRDEELGGDLASCSPVSEEAQHLDLPPAQTAGPGLARAWDRGAAGNIELPLRIFHSLVGGESLAGPARPPPRLRTEPPVEPAVEVAEPRHVVHARRLAKHRRQQR